MELGIAIAAHSSANLAVYGDALWKPKSHWALHLPRQLLVQGLLLSTFAMGRKHRAPKRCASNRRHLKRIRQGYDGGPHSAALA
eukprot:8546487-Pyramimonas_sp.AAC.1